MFGKPGVWQEVCKFKGDTETDFIGWVNERREEFDTNGINDLEVNHNEYLGRIQRLVNEPLTQTHKIICNVETEQMEIANRM